MFNNLGVTLAAQGQEDEALAQFRAAVRIAPSYAALALKPDLADARINLGIARPQGAANVQLAPMD